MFDHVFNGIYIFPQALMLAGALVFCTIGIFLFVNAVYKKFCFIRVNGTVIGVCKKDNCGYSVYSYMFPSGEMFETTDVSESIEILIKRKPQPNPVPLLVSPEDPRNISPARTNIGDLLGGIILFAAGASSIQTDHATLKDFPLTALTWALAGGILGAPCMA